MSLIRLAVVFSIILVPSGATWATTWSVAPTGCSDTTCTPCCTIQGAVGHAVGNDVISVAAGTYVEQVDFRGMATVGNITLEAASGPGTVLVSPTSGHTLRHGDGHTNTVTVDGVDFTSVPPSCCVFLDHAGDVVLNDVTVDNCGYTAFILDNTGSVVMERCTATNSARNGIQIDGASSVSLTDCTGSSNPDSGIVVYTPGTLDLVNPTAVGNASDGISVDTVGPTTITGATVTDNDRNGIVVWTSNTVTISDSTVSGSWDLGIDIEWFSSDSVDGVTLTNVDVVNNGINGGESGVRIREVDGPVVVTNCTFDGNGADGFSPETSVVGDLEIDGGHANGNLDDGYDLRVVGTVTVTGATASGNADNGFAVDNQETVLFEDCIANDNQFGSGFSISWQDPNPLDRVSISDCTANSNGLSGGGNGIIVKYVEGLVTVIGTTTNGNSRTGVRVDATSGVVFVRNAVSSFGLEEGFKIDADVGPVTVKDCLADDNGLEGLRVNGESVDVESLTLTRNTFVNNDGAGVALFDLGGAGPFKARCNDIAGNTHGMYLDSSVTVDARQVWWSDPAGPSGQGPGAGDTVYAEPGGTILFDPWLLGTFATAGWGCPISEVNFETGTLDEWDHVVP